MLYGRTNSSQLWELKQGGEELLFRGNNKVLNISGLMKGLNVALGMELFFYVFSFKKEFRFVFVTVDEVDFKRLSSPKVRGTGGYTIMVKGALYDLKKNIFVFSKDGSLNYFVIYDYGIPNVIYVPENGTHTIFSLDGDDVYSFYTTKVRTQPILVSHLWKKRQVGRPINNRLIFFNQDGKDMETMIILHEEVLMESLNEANFVETIPLNDESDSVKDYFSMIHGKDAKPDDVYVGNDSQYHLHMLTSSDCVVAEQPYKDYNIVFVNGEGHFVYSDVYDCFNYQKVIYPLLSDKAGDNVLRVFYRKNDFENGCSIFNITTGKVD